MSQNPSAVLERREIRHFHLFCGLGGGALGFSRGTARVGNIIATFRCLGGIDVNPAAIRDFERLVGVAGTVLDLFDEEQYRAFHGHEPPPDWRTAGTADIHAAAGYEHPHIIFLSAPCKGFSGLLAESKSRSEKYQALNRLTLRGIWLALEAFQDDPPELILFENVPRIANRGRHLLDEIIALLRAYGYAVAETTHDCGQLGGLAQSRRRFLLVARHQAKVPPFLYEPPTRPLRAVGDVLGRMPLPGDLGAGPMHRIPMLRWQTWVRLAFVEAGSDWRSLNKLAVENGVLRDYALVPTGHWQPCVLGVNRWTDPAGTVTGRAGPTNGAFSVADPRITGHERSVQLGARPWNEPAPVVTGKMFVGGGPNAVADPRAATAFDGKGKYRVTKWSAAAGTVISASTTGNGAYAVADPRADARHSGAISVADESLPSNGAFAIADPRPGLDRSKGDDYYGAGHFGVVPWTAPSGAVCSAAGYDNGPWSVADPRQTLPEATHRLVAVIRSLDGTWHRPFTTFELAGLQSLIEPEQQLELDGLSDADWRERIGNAVPPDAAQAIADTMATTLLLAWSGTSFMLSDVPIWVRPIAIALAVSHPPNNAQR